MQLISITLTKKNL